MFATEILPAPPLLSSLSKDEYAPRATRGSRRKARAAPSHQVQLTEASSSVAPSSSSSAGVTPGDHLDGLNASETDAVDGMDLSGDTSASEVAQGVSDGMNVADGAGDVVDSGRRKRIKLSTGRR